MTEGLSYTNEVTIGTTLKNAPISLLSYDSREIKSPIRLPGVGKLLSNRSYGVQYIRPGLAPKIFFISVPLSSVDSWDCWAYLIMKISCHKHDEY